MLYPDDMSAPNRPARIGFLLSQLGALASDSFAAKTREFGITPAEAGVLRILGRQPRINQRELAEKLGTAPSRVVALIDSLETTGYVTRSRSITDRRNQQLQLTDSGRTMLAHLRSAAEAQEAEVTSGLDPDERTQLHQLLLKLSTAKALDPDVHPSFRSR